ASAGLFEIFKDQNARTFADHEPIPALIPRPARAFGCVVSNGQRPHRGKPGDTQWRDTGLRPATDHRVSVTILDPPDPAPNRMRPGRASRRDGGVGPLCAEAHRYLPGREIHQCGDDEKRRYALGPAFEQDLMLAFNDLKAADAAPDRHANAVRIRRTHLETARSDRH